MYNNFEVFIFRTPLNHFVLYNLYRIMSIFQGLGFLFDMLSTQEKRLLTMSNLFSISIYTSIHIFKKMLKSVYFHKVLSFLSIITLFQTLFFFHNDKFHHWIINHYLQHYIYNIRNISCCRTTDIRCHKTDDIRW